MNVILPPTSAVSGLLRFGFRCFVASFAIALAISPARGATLPAGFTETQIASGLARPTAFAFAPDGRIFITEQGGAVRIVKNGALLSTPFVTLPVNSSGERGVLGVTFDPNFASTQHVYIYYTATSPTIHNRVSRFTAAGDVAQSGSELALMDLPTLSATNHNGGALHFGPDGKLYIAVGENAVPSAAQSMTTPIGKLLRINRDGTLPSDNPFFGTTTGINRAIWALGLRNPFTFAFDPTDGTMFINDVGQNTWEEVNEGIAGANYGWPTTEGATTDPRFVGPLHAYDHSNGCSIVGAAFYRPATVRFPSSYVGQYFFGDYCGGYIRQLNPNTAAASGFATGISSLVDLRVSSDGALYYLARGGGSNTGALFRIQYAQTPSISAHPQSQTVAVGQPVTFSVTAGGSSPLQYQWQRNDVVIAGATSSSYNFTAAAGDNNSTYRAVVTNSAGSATSNRATLTVTATNPNAPVATITQPSAGALYSGGGVLTFAGAGSDAEDGALPASAYTWEVVFYHDTHTHPFYGPTSGITSGTVTIPTTGETASNVFYRIRLTVTDSGGRTHTVTRDVQPRTSTITLATNPTGLQLTLDGQPVTTPHNFTGVVGIQRQLGATTPQVLSGQAYAFQSWSDGGSATHTISTPVANTTYTAGFTPTGVSPNLVLEAESLARTSTGASTVIETDAASSGGQWVSLLADSVGDYVQFTTPSIPAGTYQFRLSYKRYAERGQLVASIDGAQVGSTLEQFGTTIAYLETTLGTVTFNSAGTHVLRLTATGKNSASPTYKLSADRFRFVGGTSPTVYEGENAARSGGTVASNHSGYTGTGFVDTDNAVGPYVQWTVNVASTGSYFLDFRYANASTANRPVDLRVNGALAQAGFAMPPTGSWTTWATVRATVTLNAGSNTIRVTATSAAGTGNLDHLAISR